MPSDSDFPLNYIDIDDHDQDASPSANTAKALTMLGAAAMSVLCYESRSDVVKYLRTNDRFGAVRRCDILSHLIPLANIAGGHTNEDDTGPPRTPLMAWSNRLQLVFLAFPGTQVASDVLSDIDARQSANSQKASRFHNGFYSRAAAYEPLVRHLAQKFRVVVCGHSLGGAMATILSYLILSTAGMEQFRNTWEDDCKGLSTITFGAPTPMVVEKAGSTSLLEFQLAKNFHHVMNPQDPIPFLPNKGIKWASLLLDTIWEAIGPLLPGGTVTADILNKALRIWKGGADDFAHFGRIYILTISGRRNQTFVCKPVLHHRDLPSSTERDAAEIRFHAMDHYYEGICKIPVEGVNELLPVSTSAAESLQLLREHCLPLPAPIGDGVCGIMDGKIKVSIKLDAPLAPFFINCITFKLAGTKQEPTTFGYDPPPSLRNLNPVTLCIEQDFQPSDETKDIVAIADAVQKSLVMYDSFGLETQLIVERVDDPSLKRLSMLGTYESIRQVMLVALADQMSQVHKLRSQGKTREEATKLTEKAKRISGIVDQLVLEATPALVIINWRRVWSMTRDIWALNSDEGPVAPGAKSATAEIQEDDLSVEPLSLVPEDCDGTLRRYLYSMFASFDGLPRSEVESMLSRRLHHLDPSSPSFKQALEKYCQVLFERPIGADERVHIAVEQASELMAIMRFCHAVILTQISLPGKWAIRIKPWEGSGTRASPPPNKSFKIYIWTSVALLGGFQFAFAATGAYLSSLLIREFGGEALGGIMNLLYESGIVTVPRFQSNYEGLLRLTAEALGIPQSPFSPGLEIVIREWLQTDPDVDELRLEKWHDKLTTGLSKLHQRPSFCPTPNKLWARWLLQVGKIGELQLCIFDKTNVGVMGPTEAGKSELLTVLTSAPLDLFRSGFSQGSRTLEIQSYAPDGSSGAFHDCPGFDDQAQSVREMARLFQDVFDILIVVLRCDSARSVATERSIDSIVHLLKSRRSPRPFRILLNKVDTIDFDDENPEEFTNSIIEFKKVMVQRIRDKVGKDFTMIARRAIRRGSGTSIITRVETLEEIIQLYSTHSQMSYKGKRALCDCEEGRRQKISEVEKHQHLYKLAEEGTIWDVVSLRRWLLGFSGDIIGGDSIRVNK